MTETAAAPRTRTRTRTRIEEEAQRISPRFCTHRDAVAREWCNGGEECADKARRLDALRAEWRAAR